VVLVQANKNSRKIGERTTHNLIVVTIGVATGKRHERKGEMDQRKKKGKGVIKMPGLIQGGGGGIGGVSGT